MLTSRTIRDGVSAGEMIRSINGRFQALAASQRLIGSIVMTQIGVEPLFRSVVQPLAPRLQQLQMSGTPVAIAGDVATNLALVMNELGAKALKYGAWWKPEGSVQLSWETEAASIVIQWSEHNGPPVNMPTRFGAGAILIKNAISVAVVDYHLASDGARCTIKIPLAPAVTEMDSRPRTARIPQS